MLDDYQAIQNAEIHASLAFLIEHVPPSLHIVISSRADPPWPLARYRARDLLVEIRAPDLRFSPRETGDFLNRTMALDVSADDAAALTERTEGWIAGLQLAALSIRGRIDKGSFIRTFTGGHVYVADYLVDEVLHHQSPAMQRFLLQTSILDRLSGALCDAITGGQGGSATLAALHKRNVFVVPAG